MKKTQHKKQKKTQMILKKPKIHTHIKHTNTEQLKETKKHKDRKKYLKKYKQTYKRKYKEIFIARSAGKLV